MDRIEAMTMLLSVVEMGSLSAAARAQNVPVSTLTRKVTDLEQFLGVRLLIRTTRKLTLTDAGAAYVTAARDILARVKEQEREAAGEFSTPRGELVVATPVQFGRRHVLPIVNEFLALYPEISVRLLQSDRNVDLIDTQADLAVRIGLLPDSSMIATRVGSLRAVVCASPSLLATHGMPRLPTDLSSIPCVVFDSPYLAPWRFRSPGGEEITTLHVEARLHVSAPDAAADAAIAGTGVTMLLEHDVAEAVQAGRLIILLPEHEIEPLPVHILRTSRNSMPLKIQRFTDFAVPKLREALGRFGKPAQACDVQ